MAWPVDSPYQTFVANVTTIVAAFLNSVQAVINGIVGGTKSIKAITIDGTGDSATVGASGVARLNGDGTDDTPCRQTTAIPVAYLLVNEYALDATFIVREYAGSTGAAYAGFVRTVNARYQTSDLKWYRDGASNSTMQYNDSAAVYVLGYSSGSADGWLDAAWGIASPGSPDVSLVGSGVVRGRGGVTAQSSNLEATGDPASDQGRVKGKQFVSTASLATAGAGLVVANVGQAVAPDNTKVVLTGTDNGGVIQVKAEAGAIAGIVATITFTKAFPTGSTVLMNAADPQTAALTLQPSVGSSASAWTITTPTGAPLISGTTYNWKYIVAGY